MQTAGCLEIYTECNDIGHSRQKRLEAATLSNPGRSLGYASPLLCGWLEASTSENDMTCRKGLGTAFQAGHRCDGRASADFVRGYSPLASLAVVASSHFPSLQIAEEPNFFAPPWQFFASRLHFFASRLQFFASRLQFFANRVAENCQGGCKILLLGKRYVKGFEKRGITAWFSAVSVQKAANRAFFRQFLCTLDGKCVPLPRKSK